MGFRMRFAAVAVTLFFAAPNSAVGQDPSGSLSGDDRFTIALTGDAIITRRLSPYKEPQFLEMIELLRSADAAFTNLEMLLHDYEPFPAASSGGTYMRGEPSLAGELAWAGIDLVSMANNHTGDYGADGHRMTRRYVQDAGIVAAGTGENLAEAREARFLETQDGRVALISVASSFTDHSVAGPAKGGVRGRPGLNPLHINSWHTLAPDDLERLGETIQDIGLNTGRGGGAGPGLTIFGNRILPGEDAGQDSEPDPRDVEEITAVVRSATRLADYVLVTIHAHNQGPYLQEFARAVIDAGADIFVGHGPHFLTGIEIYKGKPIMYSLGDFIFQNETLLRLPYDNFAGQGLADDPLAWVADFNSTRYQDETTGFPVRPEIWESVVAMPTFEGERLVSLELHPISLGFGKPTTVRGRPMLADRELGRKIIQDLIEASEPHGTTIEWLEDRGIGVVRLR